MEKIDYDKNLSLGTILKLMTASNLIIWIPFAASMIYSTYTGNAAVTVNNEQVYGSEAVRIAIWMNLIMPFAMALGFSISVKAFQPVNVMGTKFFLFSLYGYIFKKMLQLGYWILCLFSTPTINYTKNWREE